MQKVMHDFLLQHTQTCALQYTIQKALNRDQIPKIPFTSLLFLSHSEKFH